MRLESARDLKQHLMSEIVMPVAAVASKVGVRSVAAFEAGSELAAATTTFAVGARSFETVPEVQRSVALGVARHNGGYRLAIRVQRPSLMAEPLVEHLVRQARGEVEVRMIGRIDKRAVAAPARAERRGTTGGAATAASAAVPWYRSNARPLRIGVSIGHVDVTAGTLGAFVARDDRLFVLSNNHVLANEDKARSGDWIVQRAKYDGGREPRDHVARVRRWVRLRRRGANFVDAALAVVESEIEIEPSLLYQLVGNRNRRLAGLGQEMVDEGETVYKVGRTTGATRGRVTAFDLDNVVVNYDVGNLRFDGQIEIEGYGRHPFSDGGDSGSLIVNRRMEAVALLFAGGETGGRNGLGLTYANPIRRVLHDLDATLLS